ncbi:MAG: DNA gyrase subunit A [Candidatus Eisenbacteria bacterium]|uniref:DNA gyrase subunit A n=1 Tax=Eiseniibacteriota bacterium TaxID=2212470 RepID=A0A948RYF0_UNCEI|nr:DNA gyrase subunit A [Candidatus Eisenbacteria bacterium]MBU1947440.1 DNA gyrase subunit A [Candidatus Eisenbacteria bacterium]MBU2693318.1 DNA gyrase subunit A [Candidatus Eisenbacteria bacterium]
MENIIPVAIEEEMKSSYIDYAMSVIVSRAIPDARDGLKPVQRRILVAMNDLGLHYNRGYRKSAKITGDVTGNYHPHGTLAVYDTMVRMVQDFSLRYPLVNGQGNFGSIDGDSAAAERYTEARMTLFADNMLLDIDSKTVDFRPNYDETREEPDVLPARLPNLILNGAAGIAVGMATNIPPHNFGEIVRALYLLADNPECSIDELMEHVKGPDFPTAGIIVGRQGIRSCYETGRGLIMVRARANIEEIRPGRMAVIVTEIPYQVNKTSLIEKAASLVHSGHITGITDIRDESDREGIRIVFELHRDAQPQVVLNQLYKHTQMQTTFGANVLALVKGRPKTLNLKEMLQVFLDHREEVITRRTQFDLDQAEERAHILEGLKRALDDIDRVIEIIRSSREVAEAKANLMSEFSLSDRQAQAILEMRLQRLVGLEREKLEEEYLETIKRIEEYKSILGNRAKVFAIIKQELTEADEIFGDERRTEITAAAASEIDIEDLIPQEDMIITISHKGYIKRASYGSYRSQRRGGRGLTGAKLGDEDFLEHVFVANTHSYILFFTDSGRCYWLKVYEIPEGSRYAKGRSIMSLVGIGQDETLAAFVPVKDFEGDRFILTATRRGKVKKTALQAYSYPRKGGVAATGLEPGDEVISAVLTEGDTEVILTTKYGKANRFSEQQVRTMGRTAAGVRGVRFAREDDETVAMVVLRPEVESLLLVTEEGYGKRTRITDFPTHNRGGQGVRALRLTDKTGAVVMVLALDGEPEVVVMTAGGMVIRQKSSEVRRMGRDTQGVKLVNLVEGDRVVDMTQLREDVSAHDADESSEADNEDKGSNGGNGNGVLDVIEDDGPGAV